VRGGEEFEAAELPWFLTLHWGWLLAAEAAEKILRVHFHWTSWASLNVYILWSFLQAGWLSRVDQRSTAIYWYVVDLVLGYAATSGVIRGRFPAVPDVLALAVAVTTITGLFHLRRDMTRYFKDTDDVDLHLGGWMTYFFNTLYFQYQFCEVARLRNSDSLQITPIAR
jgi:hypothetical protein